MPQLSQRLRDLPASPTRKLAPFAVAAQNRGVHVYHLNIGDSDLKTPDVMLQVLQQWTANPIAYSPSTGNPAFLKSLQTYYHQLGYHFVDKEHIQVTTGGSEAISMALFATCAYGDEVLVFEPFYGNYNTYAGVNGVTLVPVATTINNGFHLPDQEIIEAAITKKTRAILICTPNNPTGTIYNKEEMQMLVEIVKKHHLFLLSDEVYREFVYDKKQHVSLLDFINEIPEQAILLDSLSKRYSLCGARLGALISLNKDLMAGVLRIAQGRLSTGTIDQAMGARLVDVPDAYIEMVKQEYEDRRTIIFEGLSKIPGVTLPKPEGAFYVMAALPVLDSEHFCRWLLTDFSEHNETIMLAPGAGFYASKGSGKNEVRIAYVLNRKDLVRSVELLALALKRYAHEEKR